MGDITSYNSAKQIAEVADDITSATKSLGEASKSLRKSYSIETKNPDIIKIRVDITNRASVYYEQIMPFSADTIGNIKSFCRDAIFDDYKDFKKNLSYVKNEAESNAILCRLTLLFHKKILTEFKMIEDNTSTLIEKLGLSYKYHEEKNERLGGDTTSSENERFEAMKHLGKSIGGYVDALIKISGFFFVLFKDLCTIHGYSKRDDFDSYGELYHRNIKKYAGDISKACDQYNRKVMDCDTDVKCFSEYKNKEYVDKWIRKVLADEDDKMHQAYSKFVENLSIKLLL